MNDINISDSANTLKACIRQPDDSIISQFCAPHKEKVKIKSIYHFPLNLILTQTAPSLSTSFSTFVLKAIADMIPSLQRQNISLIQSPNSLFPLSLCRKDVLTILPKFLIHHSFISIPVILNNLV